MVGAKNNDDLGLFTYAPREKLKGALKDFFVEYKEKLESSIGINLPTVIHLSYGLANMVSDPYYLTSAKKDEHQLYCAVRGIVYTAIRTLSEDKDHIVPAMSAERIAELRSENMRCNYKAITKIYGRINKNTIMKDLTISYLKDLADNV